jgi:hypothetical protein
MKKIVFFTLSLFISLFVFSQSVVVLHSTDTTAVFTGNTAFEDAYNLSESGDTLFLSGGGFSLVDNFEKGLVVFGAGIHPDSTSATYQTQLSGMLNIKTGADNLYFEGIMFASNISENAAYVVNNISFVRCKFNSNIDFGYGGTPSVNRTNYAFIQCVFMNNVDMDGVTNSLFTNCIFNNRVSRTYANSFKNCCYLYDPTSSSTDIFNYADNNLIFNNIFLASSPYIMEGNSNTFRNNVFGSADPNLGATPIDVSNYKDISMDVVFEEVPAVPFVFQDNYHLLTTAAEIYLGEDLSQVGVYGGLFPLKEGFVPQNPHINYKNISAGTDENGLLNIQINVNAQEN